MAFSVDVWQKQASEKYTTLIQWLNRQKTSVGYMAYGALTTFTIWPLVEAVSIAAQSGQPLPINAILALGSVAGSVGGNLLASQIQNWYEKAAKGETPTEEDVLHWLSENAVKQGELQTAVDQMLESLEAVNQAQAALPQETWQDFAQALYTDVQKLGHMPRTVARIEGQGVIVQGDHNKVAAFGGAIVEGDVKGDLVMGDQTKQVIDPNQVEPDALRRAYLSRLFENHNRLLLGGIDPKATTSTAASSQQLQLSAVYTALLTESSEKEHLEDVGAARNLAAHGKQPRQQSALEKLNMHKDLVLLGDPGSGKSTFVSFVTLCLAGEALDDTTCNLQLLTTPLPPDEARQRGDEKEEPQPQPWQHGALLPVCIVLRDFAARGLPGANQPATAEHLWQFVESELQAGSLGAYAPLLKKELLEDGGIFLFDGLDEVQTAAQHRTHIKQVVEDIARTYKKCRVLVTSRTYAYQKQAWRLPGFNETVLAAFSKGQIDRFVDRWYTHVADVRHMDSQIAQGRAALLKQAIFSSKRLYDLAERPLLLTLMASLHAWRGGSLPEKREELYADAVDLLLDTWEQQRIVYDASGEVRNIQPSLEQWLQVDRDRVRNLLNRLAYEAHAKQTNLVGTADIAESDLVMGLLRLSEDKSLQPAELVDYISNRAGLLLPRGVGVYTFPHRTFQEYLAACHLTAVGYPAKVAQLARTEPNRWREVALLAGAKAARGTDYALWGLVEELCHNDPGAGDEADYWGAHLAGQFLLETAVSDEPTRAQQKHIKRVHHWLVHVLSDPVLPATERALAGRHLAKLGDPRPEVTAVDAMQFCLVPGGDFWMGEGDEAHKLSFLDYDYGMGRYPVTNKQYWALVGGDG